MNDVITGANGFIGSHLSRKLPLARKLQHSGIPFLVPPYMACDRLFFLSTYGNMASHTDTQEMVKANVIDLLNVIRRNKPFVIYMSSSSVMLPIQTPYSRTKRAAEEILQALPELKSCIVRPYSVTGVGEQKEHLIPTLIRSCMEGTPMDFDASPVHDFVDVADVVDGLIALANAKATGIHEFGRGTPISNQVVKETVEMACSKKANIQSHQRMREYDNRDWYCSNPSPYFKATKSLSESIQEMVQVYNVERGWRDNV